MPKTGVPIFIKNLAKIWQWFGNSVVIIQVWTGQKIQICQDKVNNGHVTFATYVYFLLRNLWRRSDLFIMKYYSAILFCRQMGWNFAPYLKISISHRHPVKRQNVFYDLLKMTRPFWSSLRVILLLYCSICSIFSEQYLFTYFTILYNLFQDVPY